MIPPGQDCCTPEHVMSQVAEPHRARQWAPAVQDMVQAVAPWQFNSQVEPAAHELEHWSEEHSCVQRDPAPQLFTQLAVPLTQLVWQVVAAWQVGWQAVEVHSKTQGESAEVHCCPHE